MAIVRKKKAYYGKNSLVYIYTDSFYSSDYLVNAEWVDSGANEEYAFFQLDITNLQKKPVSFPHEASVKFIYNNNYELNGWIRHSNPNYASRIYSYASNHDGHGAEKSEEPRYNINLMLDPTDDEEIGTLQTGMYFFGCTLPNAVVTSQSPLRVEISIGGQKLVYPVRGKYVAPTPKPTAVPTPKPTAAPTPAPSPNLTASATAMGSDGTFTVTLGLKNNPGIGFISIITDAASKGITLEKAETTNIAGNATVTIGNKIVLFSNDEMTGNGNFLILTMKSSDKKETTLSFTADEAYNINEQTVTVAGTNVTIKKGGIIGDCNGDGKVDGRDLLRLARYIAGSGTSVDLSASDINGDGQVDGRDVLRLAKKLAGG